MVTHYIRPRFKRFLARRLNAMKTLNQENNESNNGFYVPHFLNTSLNRMADKIEINGRTHLNTAEAAKRLRVQPKRVLDFIADERIEAVYLHGYYIPEDELLKVKKRKRGRPKNPEQE